MLGQCQVKFDSEHTLSQHRSIVFTVSGSYSGNFENDRDRKLEVDEELQFKEKPAN